MGGIRSCGGKAIFGHQQQCCAFSTLQTLVQSFGQIKTVISSSLTPNVPSEPTGIDPEMHPPSGLKALEKVVCESRSDCL